MWFASRLRLVNCSPPPTRAGHESREVLRVRPGKDTGTLASFYTEFAGE